MRKGKSQQRGLALRRKSPHPAKASPGHFVRRNPADYRKPPGAEPAVDEGPSKDELEELATAPEPAVVPESEEIAEKPEVKERHSRGQDNAYSLYLREIGQTKLLTPQEEIVLAKRIREGDESAREQMIKANLRLVVKIARDY